MNRPSVAAPAMARLAVPAAASPAHRTKQARYSMQKGAEARSANHGLQYEYRKRAVEYCQLWRPAGVRVGGTGGHQKWVFGAFDYTEIC